MTLIGTCNIDNLPPACPLSPQNNSYLSGTIPSQLGRLTDLEGLSLSFNRISGTIPSQLGELTNLKSLSLRDNYLISGTLPTQLGKLTSISTRMTVSYTHLRAHET